MGPEEDDMIDHAPDGGDLDTMGEGKGAKEAEMKITTKFLTKYERGWCFVYLSTRLANNVASCSQHDY